MLPIGYGDGFCANNQGHALIHGKRAPIVGGIAMDALMVDVSDIAGADVGRSRPHGRARQQAITARDVTSN